MEKNDEKSNWEYCMYSELDKNEKKGKKWEKKQEDINACEHAIHSHSQHSH